MHRGGRRWWGALRTTGAVRGGMESTSCQAATHLLSGCDWQPQHFVCTDSPRMVEFLSMLLNNCHEHTGRLPENNLGGAANAVPWGVPAAPQTSREGGVAPAARPVVMAWPQSAPPHGGVLTNIRTNIRICAPCFRYGKHA
eukprot:1195133-Prorocentrum_minimum.AAC.4